jgi:hypothetical protein
MVKIDYEFEVPPVGPHTIAPPRVKFAATRSLAKPSTDLCSQSMHQLYCYPTKGTLISLEAFSPPIKQTIWILIDDSNRIIITIDQGFPNL